MAWLFSFQTLTSLGILAALVLLSIYIRPFRYLFTMIVTSLAVITIWVLFIVVLIYMADAPWVWNILSQTWWIVQILVVLLFTVPLAMIMILPGTFVYMPLIAEGLWWLQNRICELGDVPEGMRL